MDKNRGYREASKKNQGRSREAKPAWGWFLAAAVTAIVVVLVITHFLLHFP